MLGGGKGIRGKEVGRIRGRVERGAYLDFVDDVEGVLEAGVGEDDLVECVGEAVGGGFAFEGVDEVGLWVWYPRDVAAEDNEASQRDEDKGENFDNSDAV